MNKVIFTPPSVTSRLYNANGYEILTPAPAFRSIEMDFNQWIVARCTPTNVASSFDPVNSTQSNAGAIVEKNLDSVTMFKALFVCLTARRKTSASGNLLDNTVIVSIGATEIGRIYVNAATQQAGQHIWVSSDGSTGDPRFLINGDNDVGISLTSVDPNLVLSIHIFGFDNY